MAAGMDEVKRCDCRLYKCKFCNPDPPRQGQQTPEADVRLNDLLSCGSVKISGAKFDRPSTFTRWDASKMGDVEDGDYEIFIMAK